MLDTIFLRGVPPELSASDVEKKLQDEFEAGEGCKKLLGVYLDKEERVALVVIDVPSDQVAVTKMSSGGVAREGRVPLHTLRADIDYSTYEAHTILDPIGTIKK